MRNGGKGYGSTGRTVVFDVCVCTVSKSDDAADEKRPHETSGWIWADFEGSSSDDRSDPVQYSNL